MQGENFVHRASGTAKISIVRSRMQMLAETVSRLPLAADFGAQMTPELTVSDENAFRAFLWAAAVCHSTKGGLKGRFSTGEFKGWDYLLRAFSVQAGADPATLAPERVCDFQEDDLLGVLTAHSFDSKIGLRDLARRAEILRLSAQELLRTSDGSVEVLLARTAHRVGGPDGAYAQLQRLSAFQDRLQKKSTVFLMTVHFSGRWKFLDHESIQPMIDYHRMRTLLRTGCIEIEDQRLAEQLRTQAPIESDLEQEIRRISLEICTELPVLANMPTFDVDVLLWAHARSCCRYEPLCVSGRAENDSFGSYLDHVDPTRCVFEGWCPGRANAEIRAFWEPAVATEDY